MIPDSSPPKVRMAIVGLGKMGLSHLAILRAHPQIELVAACDATAYLTDVLSKHAALKCHSDFDRLLAEEPLDAIVVATPSKLHADMVHKALERGLHVFCEKPFVLDVADGERRSVGGIVIPATAQLGKRLAWAEVKAAGPNVRNVEVGDQVLFSPEDLFEVEVQGATYVLLRERDVVSTVKELRGKIEELRDLELERARRALAAGEAPEQVLAQLARNLTNKLLHSPSSQLRRASALGRNEVIAWSRELFELDPQPDQRNVGEEPLD